MKENVYPEPTDDIFHQYAVTQKISCFKVVNNRFKFTKLRI